MQPDLYIDLVRAMERACSDYVMIDDGSFVPDAYQGSPECYLHNASTVPKHDPMPLVPLLAQGSSHLGIVATMTTGFYPPYLAARLGATLKPPDQGPPRPQSRDGTQRPDGAELRPRAPS